MRKSLSILLGILFCSATGSAQLISIKTVPIASGDQFMLFPSQNVAMGNLSIAVDDPLLDPFVNPAKTARLRAPLFFGSPSFYNISENNGSARTLPLGAVFRSNAWFGGATLALQELSTRRFGIGVDPCPQCFIDNAFPQRLSSQSATNLYAFGLAGLDLGNGVALGVSGFYADLSMLEGVELLYIDAEDIEQFGGLSNLRVGMLKDFKGGSALEAIALFNRVDMQHDVVYTRPFPVFDDNGDIINQEWRRVTEENPDISNTYGLHVGYQHALDYGYRVGGMFTANYKTHPKIPNYDLMRIPRDPGNSWAYNMGLGMSRTKGQATFGVDVIYEPIWSETWADTPEPLETATGGLIPVGGRTVENFFRFRNATLRTGVNRIGERTDVLFGIQVHAIRYHLDQTNFVEVFDRSQNENWQEWTTSLGFVLKFEEFHIRYLGHLKTGTGRPGIFTAWPNDFVLERAFDAGSADILLAPTGALTLQEARVFTHQISVTVPLFE